MLKHVLRHPAMQAGLAYLLGLYLAFAIRSTRWRVEGTVNAIPFAQGASAIIAFWHEQLPIMPIALLNAKRMKEARGISHRTYVLVSHHRDGRFIGTVMRRFDMEVVLGSTSRGGASALRQLLSLASVRSFLAITPDGPRGPRREAAPGVAQLAALSGLPVLPCGAQIARRRVLNTWDRMIVPKPFGRGVLVYGAPITVPRADWQSALPQIKAALDDVAEQADRLCAE